MRELIERENSPASTVSSNRPAQPCTSQALQRQARATLTVATIASTRPAIVTLHTAIQIAKQNADNPGNDGPTATMSSKTTVLYVSTTARRCPFAAQASLTSRSRLYRRSLKLSLDWAVHRYLWRGQAMYLRSLFEANKSVTEPRQLRVRCRHRR
jgi:hypothetical protein